jgi:branched-chain amino acid transport system substrate-binding protein
MTKYALLIGVSEYPKGLNSLPSVTSDIQKIEQTLENPEIGNFTEVNQLLNPNAQSMRESIEEFFKNRQRNDLLLLYFSGHGITDEEGKLYLTTRETRKDARGALTKATAVEARFLQECMNEGYSRRQVLILDCCFSGAFAEGLSAKNDGVVDIKNQLGGEGRAILTSSTSTEYSYEGVYTNFIVEGLKTGAADRDEDGEISVDELHDYAKNKVKDSGHAMTPQIFAIKEGYKITLAKAPVNNKVLQYRREAEYWVSSGDGEISELGRDALNELRVQIGLSIEEAENIEKIAFSPIINHKSRLDKYEIAFTQKIESSYPINDKDLKDLKQYAMSIQIKKEDIALIENRVKEKHKQKQSHQYKIINVIGIPLGAILIFASGFVFGRNVFPSNNPTIISNFCKTDTPVDRKLQRSLGEKILLNGDTNKYKETGIESFSKKDYKSAISNFNLYREKCWGDPEALIYLNNAKALQNSDTLRIAVSVPIGSNVNVAKEILRGVAQAQDEINAKAEINGKLLQVLIVNDNNDSSTVAQVAQKIVDDHKILAVVGHNASSVSNAASFVYLENRLVAISPTSYAQNPAGTGKYIYRVNISIDKVAIKLANHMTQEFKKSNILICRDSLKSDINHTFLNEFIKITGKNKINPTVCDFSEKNFNADNIVKDAISSGADSIVFHPFIDEIYKPIDIAKFAAKSNQKPLALFSVPTLYTQETLDRGKEAIEGMIIATPWHPKMFNNKFSNQADLLWKAPVNWRTAMAYESTKIITAALKKSDNREGVQKFLQNSFSYEGITGKVEFLESGDRKFSDISYMQIQENIKTKNLELVPLPQ